MERSGLDAEFRIVAIEIFIELTGREPKQKTDGLTWVETKHIKTTCAKLLDRLENSI